MLERRTRGWRHDSRLSVDEWDSLLRSGDGGGGAVEGETQEWNNMMSGWKENDWCDWVRLVRMKVADVAMP